MSDETGYMVDGAQATPALTAAFAAWRVECEKIEALRQKHSPDAAPWQPAAPHTEPVPRPTWLMKALEVERRQRDKDAALAEAEDTRRRAHNVQRGELEDVQARLAKIEAAIGIEVGVVPEAAAQARQQAAMDHYDSIEQRGREREAAEAASEPERQRQMNEERERSRVRWSTSERHWSEQEAREQAARRRFR
jgi:hypothetical protein